MTECPEKEYCLELKGAPIGMYHCGFCGEMILAGIDPTQFCPRVQRDKPKEESQQ